MYARFDNLICSRNGSGKSTLLKALSDKLIPGLSQSLRILLLSQVDDSARAEAHAGLSVLEHTVQGDKRRLQLLELQKGKALLLII
jgi:ATP-binding cassette, subfamily F, member 3